MSKIRFILCIFLLVVAFPLINLQAQNDSDWKKQLKEIQQNEMLRDKGYPQLVSYAVQGEVKTVDEMKRLKKKLLSQTDNYLPVVNKENECVELLNLKEIQKTRGKENVSATIKSLSEYFDHVIQQGMRTVKLTWKLHSKTYESLCVVSDNGIVYDHIIMNLMIVS